MSESTKALRRANPRASEGFPQSVEAAAEAVRARILSTPADRAPEPGAARRPRLRLVRVAATGALAVTAAAALSLTVVSRGGPGVEDAAAAVQKAATVTAASAERSGTAVVRITHNGEVRAGTTIRWHGSDLAVSQDAPPIETTRPRNAGDELRVVDGTMYGVDPGVEGGWIVLGSPKSIDPGSGTTPDEYLAAVREDIGGTTLRRIVGGVSGFTTNELDDGSVVYRGTVAAGLIARETGFKGDQPIRVLPFGYVAHDEAADPNAPLQVAVTVGLDGVVRGITVTWGSSGSAWEYTVVYGSLGATAAPVAPVNARPLRDRSTLG